MSANSFSVLDEQQFKAFHWRALITTGLGVFCDGFDLSSIGIVLPLVLASFGIAKIGGIEAAMLAGSALIGAALGALIFGVLGQGGRKRFYGLDVLLMGIMAIAQAFAPNLEWLIAIRFVLGIGIGADYVLSPTIMAEHANRANRGKTIGLGFGLMWPLGALGAGLLNFGLAGIGLPHDMQWRIVLAAGAVPAFAVLYLRRTMPETARFLARIGNEPGAAVEVIRQISGSTVAQPAADTRAFATVFASHARMIFSAALLWLLFDIVVYSGILFGPSLIAKSLGLGPVEFTLLMSIVFSLPSAFVYANFGLDRWGRKPIQVWGFVGAALLLLVFALLKQNLAAVPLLGLFVFGLYTVAINGPSIVSGAGILGVELSPTRIRTVGQSITVVGGRIGASISAFLFPLLFTAIGEVGVIALLAGVSLLGAVATHFLVPETAGQSLEALNGDDLADTVPAAAQ
ncbi:MULTISPECIES: MFS transporter [Acidiphilium]|uniref:Sugar transporter n=1 Tax=Acidiphilium rubrum TaxID=526 RepID=A0A8G2CHT7_ACIRU|nr:MULTISPECIES: MFS transporter [Acidiphilium]MBW4034150.1 MFS transporter [Pseudomonadota bacterium]SIQ10726.1 Sugar transporter [Acidiphilium rubrum]